MSANIEAMNDRLGDGVRGIWSGITTAGDPRGTRILARTIYRELRNAGLSERDVLSLATELLAQTSTDLKRCR